MPYTPTTHFAYWDAVSNGRQVKALCGKWIPSKESHGEPTCLECRAALGYRDRLDAAIERELAGKK